MTKGKTSPNASAAQLEKARELMSQGESREAMIMALNTLLQALHTLRASLLSLQNGLSEMQELLPWRPSRSKWPPCPGWNW